LATAADKLSGRDVDMRLIYLTRGSTGGVMIAYHRKQQTTFVVQLNDNFATSSHPFDWE